MVIEEKLDAYRLAAAENARWKVRPSSDPDARNLREAVRRGNRAADELRRLATVIATAGPEAVRAFGSLLDEAQDGVCNWAAFHLLELMQAPPDLVDKAFGVLERLAASDDIDAFGTGIRLRELRAQYGRGVGDV